MKKIIYIMVVVALIAIVIIRLLSNRKATTERIYQYDKEQAVHVQADTVRLQESVNIHSWAGTFEPDKESKLSAEIQGKVNAVFIDVGDVVKEGEPLIQLDNALLELQLQSVEIQIEGLEADVKRYTILVDADAIQGVQLEKAELGLKSAIVQRATLMEQIRKTTIRAPFGGIITAKLTEEGAFAAPGIPLLQVTDIMHLKFTINVPENELNRFRQGQVFSVSADVDPGQVLPGKVSLTGSKANMGNSFPVQFSVDNTPDLTIKSGMFGKVMVESETHESQIQIPASVLMGPDGRPQVYVVKNGKAFLQNIILGGRIENMVIVSGGLTGGDVIVTNGFVNLFDGANVFFE